MPERQSDAGLGFLRRANHRACAAVSPAMQVQRAAAIAAEDEVRCIDDPVAMDIIAALQHGSDIENIAESLSRQYSVATIRTAIRTLTDEGLLHTNATNVGEIAVVLEQHRLRTMRTRGFFSADLPSESRSIPPALAAAGVRRSGARAFSFW